MKFLYRISNNSYSKPKLNNGRKEACFISFLKNLVTDEDTVYIIADSVNQELKEFLHQSKSQNSHIIEVTTGSNGASFRLLLGLIKQIPRDEVVFLHEDDYLYRSNEDDTPASKLNHRLVMQGLARADYVSLYDHPDKYIPPSLGGNIKVDAEGVDQCGVFLTQDSHWKYTNSTTLTFAAKVDTLLCDMAIWRSCTAEDHPHDFAAFYQLTRRGRRVATPIPGRSTHAELAYLAPFFDWASLGSQDI